MLVLLLGTPVVISVNMLVVQNEYANEKKKRQVPRTTPHLFLNWNVSAE
jgi:hypothetical protein